MKLLGFTKGVLNVPESSGGKNSRPSSRVSLLQKNIARGNLLKEEEKKKAIESPLKTERVMETDKKKPGSKRNSKVESQIGKSKTGFGPVRQRNQTMIGSFTESNPNKNLPLKKESKSNTKSLAEAMFGDSQDD